MDKKVISVKVISRRGRMALVEFAGGLIGSLPVEALENDLLIRFKT